ncbi:tetratricopeptide repeat protein [Prosthecobacter sp.]|uniref:tetratricopeptide repeat protein n=1 Tax=Prosthecobacter sp. TaxID=1965333 RepID=UPI003783EA1B
MPPRIVLCLLLLGFTSSAQTAAVVVPTPAQRYLDILIKRPQPGTIFERFYAAWLEESSTAELGAFLESTTKLPAATAADHLLLAVFHSHRGDDRAALTAYEAALKLDPANTSAWIERSRLEARALDFAAALQSLDEAVKAKPDAAGTMEIGKLRGRALLRLGKNEEALRTWKGLAAAHAGDEDLSEELIDLLADEGQYEAALETAQALIKRSRDPVARTLRQLRLTDILLLAERRDEALKTLSETLAATGSDSWVEGDVLGRISRVFRMSDDLAGFEKFMADLVKENPQRVALAWQHAQLLGETGQKDAALKEARALLQSNPGRRDLQEGFLDLLESLDLVKEAVEQAQALTQQNTADKEMLVRLASLQHRAKDDAAAQSTLERFLKLPGAAEADHLRAARLLENWEDAPAKPGSPAALAYARLVESFPASLSAQEAQAHYLHRNGQRDAALAIWTRLSKSAALEDLLRITQALQARQESRTALDLLAPREQDFTQEPRLYALLVQLGIANKEVERALPWARKRLRLAQDAESIETAVKDILLVLRSDESGKLSAAVQQELQSEGSAPIQHRCLLAALLENAGKNTEAEKTLNSAPAEDQLIALNQLAVLFQNRQEWEKAAQTLQKVIALPGARTTARVQRMVDFYRRAEKPEQALTWIAEWKKLSPSAVQPWLDESRLLTALNRTKDAQALLRGALRKFPDSIEAASSYATLCLENGQPDEAERTYLALYEKTTDATARLRLIGPLALAAQQHNSLPRLIENFQQRQKQNRASAQPWLALAEIHRSTSSDEERRRCLYEASRLRPQDLALLLEIARSEEEIGLTAEALRTLESAAKLDKTSKTRENIARLQIDSGDADLGYRMLFEIAGGSQMDARAIEQMADTIAEKGEWERVISFLEAVLEKHPKDYRLHYLNAVALEEAGREKKAVRAFIEIMGMHEELPGVLSTGRSIGLRQQYDSMSLPPGTEDWLVLPAMVQAAYIHRQKQGGRANYGSYNPFGSTATNGLPANGFIQQAPGVTESPVLALAHVLQMVSMWDVAEREPTLRSLKQAGVSDAPLLLIAAENSPQLVITPEMLADQPQNAALHAAWLMQNQNGDPSELRPIYENAFKLFQTSHPMLALRTAALAWRTAGDQSPAWVRRILAICQAQPKADAAEMQTLISMLRTQSDLFPQEAQRADVIKLGREEVAAIITFLKQWLRSIDDQQPYYIAEVIYALGAMKDWEGVVEIIQHRLSLPDKPQVQNPAVTPSMLAGRGRGYYRNFQPSPMPVPVASLKLPMEALAWCSRLSAQQVHEENSINEAQKKWVQEFQDGLKPFIEKTREPRLKLVLRLMAGEQQAMLDELKPRLATNPALDDLLLAGWLSEQLNQSDQALAFFQQAQPLATDAAQTFQLDLAILFHAQSLLQQPDKVEVTTLLPKVKPVIEHLSQTAATQEEKYQLAQTMNSFGMEEEAEKMVQAAQGSSVRSRQQRMPVVANPYSRSYSYRQQQQKRQVSTEELLKKGDQAGAIQEIVRQLRLAIQGCLNPQNSSSAHHQIHEVINLFTKYKLTDQVMETLRTGAGWKPRQEYAVLLEHTGLETKPAIDAHRAVIAANPRAFASHARLASLLAREGDFKTALQHWKLLPEVTQAMYLPALIHEFSESSSISIPRPAALSGLLSTWLRSLPANRPLPASLTQHFIQALNSIQNNDSGQNLSFPALWDPSTKENSRNNRRWAFNDDGTLMLTAESQKARDERRAAQDQLCQAMLQIPELAVIGFAPLGGLAMFENRSLVETEKIALDLLSLRAMPKVKRRLMAQGGYQGYNGGTDPISPLGSLFATAERIAMPVPAVFATYSAALRGDQHTLDGVIFPAILKAEGKSIAEYCRAYAAVLMADEAHFVSAASAWLKPPGKGNYSHRSQQHGGPLDEIVQQWQRRKIKESLNELILSQYALPTNGYFGYSLQVVNAYIFALGERDPEALRSFVHSLRDRWIGATPELRAKNIADWREYQRQQQRGGRLSAQSSRTLQVVQGYIQWLQNLLQDRRGLGLIEFAMEDGLDNSPEWLRQIAANHAGSDRIRSAEEFLHSAAAVGFLGDAAHFRAYDLSEDQRHNTWLGNLIRQWRERSSDELLNATLTLLGKRKPSFGADLMQALLLKNSRTMLQLDGKPTPFEVAQVTKFQSLNDEGGFALRGAALQVVLPRYAKEIATMSAVSQLDLSLLLRDELRGYPQPDRLGEELTRVLAPLLKIENIELTRKVDEVLAAKTWSDLHQQEYQFTQQFPALLRDFAEIDSAKADTAARHAVELLRSSPEQKQAVLQNNRETSVHRLLTALARVPQMLHTTIALAEQEGFSQSSNWTSNLHSFVLQSLHQRENIRFIFSGTPWVAEAAEFRDFKSENNQEPTLLSSIIYRIETSSELQPVVHDILKKQPATFGTELLVAFLQRSPDDDTDARSFHSSRHPDASFILSFIQKRRDDFARLKPESAANLLAMLNARMPDLDQKLEQDAALKEALQPLISASAAQLETDIARWMQMTSLKSSGSQGYEAIQHCLPLLDRLAQRDKPRTIALLDQVSKLVAQQDALNNRGGSRMQPHQTQVAQWLQNAAAVPELYREIMQRAEEIGAAKDASWMENIRSHTRYIPKYRDKPKRFIALLENLGMLDPAATFNPHLLPKAAEMQAQQQRQLQNRPMPYQMVSPPLSLLETWRDELGHGHLFPKLAEELQKREPRTLGTGVLMLMCGTSKSSADISAFASAHADEIATASAEQKKMLAAFFERLQWAEILAPLIPALHEEFAPLIRQQEAQQLSFFEDLMKTTQWVQIEELYYKSLQTRGPGAMPNGFPGGPGRMPSSFPPQPFGSRRAPGFYPPGERSMAMDYLSKQLEQIARTAPDKAQKGLQHVSDIHYTEFISDGSPFRTPSLSPLLQALGAFPRLVPTVLMGTARTGNRIFRRMDEWDDFRLIESVLPDASLTSASKIVSTIEEMGLLTDAAAFDPVPTQFPSKGSVLTLISWRMMHDTTEEREKAKASLLTLVTWRLQKASPEVREQAARMFAEKSEARFGHQLMSALLTGKDSPDMPARMQLCSGQFAKVSSRSAGPILLAFAGCHPSLAGADSAEDGLAPFAPLLQLRHDEERASLKDIMEGKAAVMPPFRGFMAVVSEELVRLMEAGKTDEVVGLIRALRLQLEPRDAATTFGTSSYFRDGETLSEFLRAILLNSDKAATLLACELQAAARLPEVRIPHDRMSLQKNNAIKGQLMIEWENRGGWAAPAVVFDALLKDIAKWADLGSTRGLWLPLLHDMLARMGPVEQREMAAWAAKQNNPGIKIVTAELAIAQSLLDATAPAFADSASTRLPAKTPQAGKTFASAAASSTALLKNESIPSHVRLALAAFLTATYPGLLDNDTMQTWGQGAAQAWHDGTPVTVFELDSLLNAVSVLPVNESWNRISKLVLERWKQREEIMQQKKTRYTESAFHPFVLRFAARSGDSAVLESMLRGSLGQETRRFTSILLECGDWMRSIEPLFPQYFSGILSKTQDSIGWLPASAETLTSLQHHAIEHALLAEVVALDADDIATRCLYPHQQWPDRGKRFDAFVKKLPSAPKPVKPERMAPVLVTLGVENTPAALDLLPQFDELAKVLMPDSLPQQQSGIRIWTGFLAVHAALKTARGDASLADIYYERLKNDPTVARSGNSNTARSDFRHTLFYCLAQLWRVGEARDLAKISRLSLLADTATSQSSSNQFTIPQLTFALKSWQSALKGEPLPSAMISDIKDYGLLLDLATAIAGSGKTRLSFQERLHLFTQFSGRTDIATYTSQIWDHLVLRHYFTAEELLKERASILKVAHLLAPSHLNDFAMYMRCHNVEDAAEEAWAIATRKPSTSKGATYFSNRCLLDRAATLIHLKKFNEAQKCLSELNEKNQKASNRLLYAALLRLLSQPAPAPAK